MYKIKSVYEYIFFRLLLFHRKQWLGNKSLGSFNSHGAISASAIALIFSADFIYAKIFGADTRFFDNGLKIWSACIFVILVQTIIFSGDDEKLIAKYLPQKETDPLWKIKGLLSLFFVFGPLVLLIILM